MNILMPALSPTMEEGTLVKWHVKEGQEIKEGDLIAEIETDKAIMEFEVPFKGKVKSLLIEEGSTNIKVNQPILNLYDKNEKEGLRTKEEKPDNERIYISPYAKKIAIDNKIDLKKIQGSGPNKRIIKEDLDIYLDNFNNNEKSKTILKKSNLRNAIFEKMENISKKVPHFFLRKTINADELIKLREKLNNSLDQFNKISINDFFIKAMGITLKKYPDFNIMLEEKEIIKCSSSDIAIAVAIEGGLLTPIIKEVEDKSLLEISKETKTLYQKAKNRKLKPEEYIGGSTAISNLGMMNVDNFDAIINPPNTSILAVGCLKKIPIVKDDEIKIAKVINVTLSVDHRVLDGEIGAKFISEVTNVLENPYKIIY